MPLLADELEENQKQINGYWYCAKPEIAPFLCRIKDAWLVLIGKAEAVIFKT